MSADVTRRRFLRTTASLAGAGTMSAVLAACSGGTSTAGSGGNGGSGDGGGGGPIKFWQYYGTPDMPTGAALQALFDRYTEETGTRIENRFIPFAEFNRTLLQGAAGGDLPDVALVNAFDTGVYVQAGIIQDLTERVEQWGQADQYYASSWERTQWEGATYGIPHVADCYVLWYNQQLLEQAGVKPPATWAELAETAAALHQGETYGLALSAVEGVEGATAWMIRFLAEGGEFPQIDSPAGQAAMQQWVDMVAGGAMSRGVLGWVEDDVYTQFKGGTAAMMINSGTYVNTLKEEAPDLAFGVVPMPKAKDTASFLSAENLAISSGAANPDGAWDLIAYMQETEVLQEYLPDRNKLPARTDVAAQEPWSSDPIWSVFVKQLETAWAPEPEIAAKSAEILTRVQGAIQAAVSGSSPVDAALADAQTKIDEAVEG